MTKKLKEQQELLVQFWQEVVIGHKIDKLPKAKVINMRAWLLKTVLLALEDFLNHDLLFVLDNALIKDIQNSKNVKKESLQIEFLKYLQTFFKSVVNDFPQHKDNYLSFWPKQIKKNQNFNCIGSTLLTYLLLRPAKIKSFYANIYGHSHSVNVVKLQNDYWLCDFLNNRFIPLFIDQQEIYYGFTVLTIHNQNLCCQKVFLYDYEFVIANMFMNWLSQKDEVLKIINWETKYPDFNFLTQWLYPQFLQILQSQFYRQEMAFINACQKVKSIFIKHLWPNKIDWSEKKEFLKDLFIQSKLNALEHFDQTSRNVLSKILLDLEVWESNYSGCNVRIILERVINRL